MAKRASHRFALVLPATVLLATCAAAVTAASDTGRVEERSDMASQDLARQLLQLAALPPLDISRERIEQITGIPMEPDLDRPHSIYGSAPEKWKIFSTPGRSYSISLRKGPTFARFTYTRAVPDARASADPQNVCIPAAAFSAALQTNGWRPHPPNQTERIPLAYVQDNGGGTELRFDSDSECLSYLWVSFGNLN